MNRVPCLRRCGRTAVVEDDVEFALCRHCAGEWRRHAWRRFAAAMLDSDDAPGALLH
jgi:hypothetical protein